MKRIFVIVFIISALYGCEIDHFLDCYDGEFIKREVNFEKFTELDVDIPCEIELVNGDVHKIIIDSREDLISDFEKRSSVFSGVLRMRLRNHCIIRSKEVKITMVVPGLKKVDIDGNAKIFSQAKLTNLADQFELTVDGNSDAQLRMDINKLLIDVDGNAKIDLNGSASEMELKVNGNSTLAASGFMVKRVVIDIDGNANVNVHCTETLNARVDGNGKICYKGNPVVTSKISGTGKINSCN